MKKIVSLAFVLILSLSVLQITHASPYTDIDVATANYMITCGCYYNLTVLDVRTPDEYAIGHIEGAYLIPDTELDARIGELAKHANDEIIVYCGTGNKSAIASGILQNHDFTKVYNMLGGIEAWLAAGYPVTPPYMNIDIHTAYNMITNGSYPNLVILDVRATGYNITHITGSVWIHVKELEARIGELAGHENDQIIVYCGCETAVHSELASGILTSHNFTKVSNMLGGLYTYANAGYPVFSSDFAPPTTSDDYDGLWHTDNFTIRLNATDDLAGVFKTYYKINDGSIKEVSINGNPIINTEGANNKLEYWSVDNSGNIETHKTLTEIKLDKTVPTGSMVINNGDASTSSTSVTLSLTYTDSTSGVYQVRYSNDGVWDTENWEAPAATKTWTLTSVDGTKTVYYQIKNNAGLVSTTYSDTITLSTTTPPPSGDNTNPTANAGSDQTVNEDTPITFDGSASSDNVGIVSYTWTFTDVTIKTLTGQKPSYTFNTPGVYTITLNVEDAAGNEATDTVAITVLDVTKPNANAGQDQAATVGASVSFDAGASSDNVGVVSYDWNFGDRTTGTGKTTTHTYTKAGTYTVTLTVKDAAGNSATDTTTVVVPAAEIVEGFPLWMIGVVILAIAILIAAILLGRRRK